MQNTNASNLTAKGHYYYSLNMGLIYASACMLIAKPGIPYILAMRGITAPSALTHVLNAAVVYAAVHLSGTWYGVINNYFGAIDSPEFYTKHLPLRPLNSQAPLAIAFVWGVVAAGWLSALAGCAFGGAALLLNVSKKPQQELLAPVLFGGATLTALVMEKCYMQYYKNVAQLEYEASNDPDEDTTTPANRMKSFNAANADLRNGAAYTVLPLLGFIVLCAYTASRVVGYSPHLNIGTKLEFGIPLTILSAAIASELFVRNHTAVPLT